MLGAAHACANPLTAAYGIAHGVAVGVMLPHVIRFNSAIVNADYAGLLETAEISATPQTGGERLIARIVELKNAAHLPQRLRDCNVEKQALPELAKAAVSQWTGKFNPRAVSEKELLELYEAAL
jgi:alcohol dehydrogenase